MITSRILDFFAQNEKKSPFLVIDLEMIRHNMGVFLQHMSGIDIFYAVKANPDSAILQSLGTMQSCYDCASIKEIEMVLAIGITADRISYGNTIKKESDIAIAYAKGIRLFAVDSFEEVSKIIRVAPGSRIFCRILCDNEGAEWPLSYKFGCSLDMAIKVLLQAHHSGLEAYGVSFHVGSQMTQIDAWDKALIGVQYVFTSLMKYNIIPKMVNMGGGFPTQYMKKVPEIKECAQAIQSSLTKHLGFLPSLRKMIEPGRSILSNSGVIKSEVVLISKKSEDDPIRWVFLDIGKFGGLAETAGEAIRYPICTKRDSDIREPCIIAGPTCDSTDVLYQINPYMLPVSLMVGDEVFIENTAAYTTTYASVAFNGFEPLKSYVI
ncbi:MAG: type III PLP-dependent enzyme [Candidatus Liberibacter ctenarytainae]|uniref:Type III PLP-dependent enzyme n=1 Tax=Candidatus Liberibacter ctenarytainae TaxID=2020335 RepID=A0A937AKJ4_9HYPH|nr:type III PLP-dependent enzyme [Candidatus Liberibacter ctenarytainae]